MGFAGMSYGSWMMIGIVALIMFGPEKMKIMSRDLGEALAAFKAGLQNNSPDQ